ncbi:unnamed protein product, partial [Discosporangium mesarthrocarpum]
MSKDLGEGCPKDQGKGWSEDLGEGRPVDLGGGCSEDLGEGRPMDLGEGCSEDLGEGRPMDLGEGCSEDLGGRGVRAPGAEVAGTATPASIDDDQQAGEEGCLRDNSAEELEFVEGEAMVLANVSSTPGTG